MENTLILLEVLGVCVERAWSCTNAWLLDSGRFRTRKQHRISIFLRKPKSNTSYCVIQNT